MARPRQQLRQPCSQVHQSIPLHRAARPCVSSAAVGRQQSVFAACRLCCRIIPGHFVSPDARLCLMYATTCPHAFGCTALPWLSDSTLQRSAVHCCGQPHASVWRRAMPRAATRRRPAGARRAVPHQDFPGRTAWHRAACQEMHGACGALVAWRAFCLIGALFAQSARVFSRWEPPCGEQSKIPHRRYKSSLNPVNISVSIHNMLMKTPHPPRES